MKYVDKIELLDELTDIDRYFSIGYCPEIEEYIMSVVVTWIAWYDRYYIITKDDYMLYKNDKETFYNKYEKEIKKKQDCFTEKFIGAGALRDYDGAPEFQHAYDANGNSWKNYGYHNGILYAHIKWDIGEIFVPPVQAIVGDNGEKRFPLRDNCILQKDKNGIDICYRLKKIKTD